MNSYGNMLLVAMPIFLLLILVEIFWGWWYKSDDHNVIDAVSSLTSGMTNILKSTLGISLVILSYPWLVEHLQLITWNKSSVWPYIITFVFMDFTGYWTHRLQHRINFFWNHHIIHHSSEEFNLPCALRQQISVLTNIYTFLMLPLAVIGIPGEVLALVGPIHLFSQFWYHTKYINRLGFLEHILVTPSHHRVHHAMNDIYMDKNYSQIFIVWDKWFGTFQQELDTEPCVYGMRRPAQTWNPFIINYKHLWQIIKDAWHTENTADKFRVWYMPTGWRPADVEKKYPLFTISKMTELKKYNPVYSNWFRAFSVIHIFVIFLLLSFLFYRFGEITRTDALINGTFLMMAIFGFTALLDKKQYGILSMVLVTVAIIIFSLQQGDWFGLHKTLHINGMTVAVYFTVTTAIALYFYRNELRLTPAGSLAV